MANTFPEQQARITAIVKDEEESFSKTLDKGLLKFQDLASKVGDDKVFSLEDANLLYTSIGFRVELTQLMAEEISMTVDIEEFEKRMQGFECCCSSSNKSGGNSGKEKRLVADQTLALVNAGVAATDDSAQHFTEELTGCKP